MNGREKTLIAVVMVLAIALGGAVYALLKSRQTVQPPPHSESPSAGTPKPATQDMAGMDMSASSAGSSVDLTEEEEKGLGLQLAKVWKRTLKREMRTVGKVAEAETQASTISARIGGRIDRLMVRFTGENIRKGQPVASIYSPEVVSSAEEYRLALENLEKLKGKAVPDAINQAQDLVAASKRRLELWGLSPAQIREIEKGGSKTHITIFSTTSGTVTDRKATEGQHVKEGDVLFMLSDLSRIWVLAEVFESDLPSLHIGTPAEVSLEGTSQKWRGKVNFIDPMVNEQSRTVPVRIEVPNNGMKLRPGMFVQVVFSSATSTKVLSVPRTAVVDAGMHKLVYVAKDKGTYERREVEVGPASDDFYPVLSGLKEGERVVTQGAFLIDSQTRLTGGVSGQFAGSKEYSPQDAKSQPASAGTEYQITFNSEPEQPSGGSPATFHVTVSDVAGKPVSDADVSVRLFMPAMPSMGMGAMEQTAQLSLHGTEYSGHAVIPSAGAWNVTVEAKRGGKRIAIKQSRLTAK